MGYQEFLVEPDSSLHESVTFSEDRLDCLLQLRSIDLGVWVLSNPRERMRRVLRHVTSLEVDFYYDR